MKSTGEVYRSLWLVSDMFVWFALDNVDFLEFTPFGINKFYGTAVAVYQTASDSYSIIPIDIDPSPHFETLEATVLCEILPCDKPVPTAKKCACTLNSGTSNTELNKKKILALIAGCLDFKESKVEVKPISCPGTWWALNSLLSPFGPMTNIALVPPLIRLLPTDRFTGKILHETVASDVSECGEHSLYRSDGSTCYRHSCYGTKIYHSCDS